MPVFTPTFPRTWPRGLLPAAWLALTAWTGVACTGGKPCSRDAACTETELCDTETHRCVTIAQAPLVSCQSDGDCPDGRRCANGTCRHGGQCMNLAGTYDVYNAAADGGTPQQVALSNTGNCQFTSTAVGGGQPAVALAGTLDLTGHMARTAPSTCDADTVGDETLRVVCGATGADGGGGMVFHYYARRNPAAVDQFVPRRCGDGVTPCNGRECPPEGCGALVPCPRNSLGVPVCTR